MNPQSPHRQELRLWFLLSQILWRGHRLGGNYPTIEKTFSTVLFRTDVLELKKWALETRSRINEEGYVLEASVKPQIFAVFLHENHGQQWKIKFLRPAAEPLFAQMMAYVVGYAPLTSHTKQLLRWVYETWSVEQEAGKLRLLAEWGSFLEIEKTARDCRSLGAF